jgi:RimJ/RimL family protein N-acetyltransferase
MPYSPPPLIETARLELRPFASTDLDALAGIYADLAVMATIRGGAHSREQTSANIQAYTEEWEQHGYGVWAVTEKPNSMLLGMCGFVARAELGYILARAAWGRGIATEAAGACLRYGFETLGYEEISAGALRGNTGSLRVIEKLGLRQTPNEFFDAHGGVYFTLVRAAYVPTPTFYHLRDTH